MNKCEFYSKLLQEDFPVKYRQDFAEHDSQQCKKIADLKSQLVEAVGLLVEAVDDAKLFLATDLAWKRYGNEIDKIEARYDNFLARHAQAEQQEAQGAQGGDDGYAPSPEERAADLAIRDRVEGRAALATQPAAGEPVKYWAFRNEDLELCITDRWDVAKHLPFDVIPLVSPVTVVAAPASTHGDERAALPERREVPYGTWGDMGDAYNAGWNDCLDQVAEMRAQGDEES